MIKKGDLVVRTDDYDRKKFPYWSQPAVVVRGPYETVMKLTNNLTAAEQVVDVMINGMVYLKIPIIHLKQLK